MLRTVNGQPTLWESILPEVCLVLPGDLAAVDRLLDDRRFFEPFEAFFSTSEGRPSIPIETYLRMMFLKHRYGLGYEPLCAEVNDSIAWRRFCRVPLDERTPHPTTLMKITTKCGPGLVDELNDLLLVKANASKLIKTDRVRADTTVIEADIKYPTDSGLLTRAVGSITRLVDRIQATGAAARTTVEDRTGEARAHAHSIGAWLRRRNEEAKAEVLAITIDLAVLAESTSNEAAKVAANARRFLAAHPDLARAGKLARMIADLEVLVSRTERVVTQARSRAGGTMPEGATRLVSLHEPDARPIRKGRLGRPVEFGYKAQIVDNTDGIVLDYTVEIGNPADAEQLAPAIGRVKERVGRAPDAVTADRGYGYAKIDKDIRDLGVATVVIPRAGKPGEARRAEQVEESFVELVKWRTGCEGRISTLKRDYGMRRTRLRSHNGHEPGSATASSPTTSPRSPGSPHDHHHARRCDHRRRARRRGVVSRCARRDRTTPRACRARPGPPRTRARTPLHRGDRVPVEFIDENIAISPGIDEGHRDRAKSGDRIVSDQRLAPDTCRASTITSHQISPHHG